MTACRNKARGAVVAALAGALTLGAAPVMALADGASLMAQGGDTLKDAVITYEEGTDVLTPESIEVSGALHELAEYKSGTEISKDGYYFYYVKLDSNGPVVNFNGTTVQYLKGEDKVDLKGSMVSDPTDAPGTYAVVVGYYATKADMVSGWASGWNVVPVADTFTVAPSSLAGATLVEDGDVDDTTFEWDGTEDGLTFANLKVDVAVDGVVLDEDTDYDIKLYDSKNSAVTTVVPGTEYTAEIVGKDKFAGQDVVRTTFELEPLNLTNAKVVAQSGTAAPDGSDISTIVKSINDVATGSSKSTIGKVDGIAYISATLVSSPSDPSGNGAYVFELSAAELAHGNPYVTGTKQVTVIRADRTAVIEYDGNADGHVVNVDLSADDPEYFDESKLAATSNGYGVDPDRIEVAYTDAEGHEASAEDVKTLGTWYANVTVDYTNTQGQSIYGTATFKIVVTNGDLDDADVYFTLDGDNVVSSQVKQVTYDGQDWLDKLSVRVVAGGEDLDASDYEVKVTKDKKPVDSIVDAGQYVVEVSSDYFNGTQKITIDVQALALTSKNARVTFPTAVTYKEYGVEKTVVPYTGEAIEPVVEVALTEDEDGEPVWTALDASLYDLTYGYCEELQPKSNSSKLVFRTLEEPESIVEVGYYKVVLDVDTKATANYTGSDVNFTNPDKDGDAMGFEVADVKVFADVPNDEYYTQAVYTAVSEGYVEGMGGSNLFMPNKSISRADMVVVLYRMAGGSLDSMKEGMTNEEISYVTGFGDVDKNAYYAKALAWAAKAGIVTGYEDGNFGPADDVTVEQYVTMLARYAEVVGNYEAVDTDEVLAGVADGSQVSEFGQDAVAWAVESGYLAQGGADIQPQSPVSRGRAITIAVRYQPEQANVIRK